MFALVLSVLGATISRGGVLFFGTRSVRDSIVVEEVGATAAAMSGLQPENLKRL